MPTATRSRSARSRASSRRRSSSPAAAPKADRRLFRSRFQPSRAPLLLLAVLLVVLVAGCEVSAELAIDVRDDGSGTVHLEVHLDPDAVVAAEHGGEPLEEQVRLGDLDEAGWDVGWEREDDAGATLRLEKEFDRAEELGPLVEELDGPSGPLRDVDLEHETTFWAAEYRIDGVADLAAIGTGIATDEDLVAVLAAERIDVAALDAQLMYQLREAFSLTVSISLPGEATRTYTASPGSTVDLGSESSVRDWRTLGWLIAAAVLATGAIMVLLASRRHNRRRGATS